MEKLEILPPDELQIESELADIVGRGNSESIARWSGIQYWRIRAMLRENDPTRNVIYEAAMLIYGCLKHDREIGKRAFNILYRLGSQWGLIDSDPIDTLIHAKDRISQIKREDLRRLNSSETDSILANAARLEQEITRVTREAVEVSAAKELAKRGSELDGRGRGESAIAKR